VRELGAQIARVPSWSYLDLLALVGILGAIVLPEFDSWWVSVRRDPAWGAGLRGCGARV
jgi:hypothetical protein